MFKGEIEEGIGPVRQANKLMILFRKTFDKYKDKILRMFPPGNWTPTRKYQWDFDPKLVFHRYTQVHDRLKMGLVSNWHFKFSV